MITRCTLPFGVAMDHRYTVHGFGNSGGCQEPIHVSHGDDHRIDGVMRQTARGGSWLIPFTWSVMLSFLRHVI
jgi:hypothetical protein